MPKRHRQLRLKDLPKVLTWRLKQDSNPRPFGWKAKNLPMSQHVPQCILTYVAPSSPWSYMYCMCTRVFLHILIYLPTSSTVCMRAKVFGMVCVSVSLYVCVPVCSRVMRFKDLLKTVYSVVLLWLCDALVLLLLICKYLNKHHAMLL